MDTEGSILGAPPQGLAKKLRSAVSGAEWQQAYIAAMTRGNPKLLLTQCPLFHGFTPSQLPFIVQKVGPDQLQEGEVVQYEGRIRLDLPNGDETWGVGRARTKKEAERFASIDAIKQLNERGLLVAKAKHTEASATSEWGTNPKNLLTANSVFKDKWCARLPQPLPITLSSTGPDHSKLFIAELPVPLSDNDLFVAVGRGSSKAEAERKCCICACEKLHEEGLLQKPRTLAIACPDIFGMTLQVQQQNEDPTVVDLQQNELAMIEHILQTVLIEKTSGPATTAGTEILPHDAKVMNGATDQVAATNAMLHTNAKHRMSSPEFSAQLRARQSLPAWTRREEILDVIRNNPVTLLTGETGSGKTTQVPQFILEEAELQGFGADVHILVTQPRRIAAMSVAERVAWERGEEIGKSVGYIIRLESAEPRPHGSILYCTTGILLRRLQRADGLANVSHLIIDEAHERDVHTDFLLVAVREILKSHPSLRLIIMSATINVDLFTRYFVGCAHLNISGKSFPVEVCFLEDIQSFFEQHGVSASAVANIQTSDDDEVDIDLVSNVILSVSSCLPKSDGAILCFLPGWDAILKVRDRLRKLEGSRKSLMIVPLHSLLPSDEQRLAFSHSPVGLRKVILSTNIAETSITIDDIICVIDSGKMKEKKHEPSRNMATLRMQWISQASARQRQGRAGRVQAGFCFRLYTKETYLKMDEHHKPEIQRIPLEELCLQVKAFTMANLVSNRSYHQGNEIALASIRGLTDDIAVFLSKALEPPQAVAVETAIHVLQQMGAMDERQNLTPIGRTLAKLNVHPRYGKMLMYGALLGCLEPILTIAAAACYKDPFAVSFNKNGKAGKTRQKFAVLFAYGSDHLSLVTTFEQWMAAHEVGEGHLFCEKNSLSHVVMKLIAGTREQFRLALKEAGLLVGEGRNASAEANAHLARCVLMAGLCPNIAKSEICKQSKGAKRSTYRWTLGFRVHNGRVLMHPGSIVQEKELDAGSHHFLVFDERVQSVQYFAQGCTLVPSLAIILFGWKLNECGNCRTSRMLLEVNDWLKFDVDREAGTLLLQLHRTFNDVLYKWIATNQRAEAEVKLVNVVITLLESASTRMLLGTGQ